MKYPEFAYEPETDTLVVQLSAMEIEGSIEPAPGIIVSIDNNQQPVLIEFMGPVRKWFAPLIDHFMAEAQRQTRRAG